MAAKYAKIDRVDTFDADFQQVPLVQNFWNFPNIVMDHQWFKIRNKKSKQNFFNNIYPKLQFTIDIA